MFHLQWNNLMKITICYNSILFRFKFFLQKLWQQTCDMCKICSNHFVITWMKSHNKTTFNNRWDIQESAAYFCSKFLSLVYELIVAHWHRKAVEILVSIGSDNGALSDGTRPLPRPISTLIPGSWGQHGAHLGPTGPRWAPCWPHEPCYLVTYRREHISIHFRCQSSRCWSPNFIW